MGLMDGKIAIVSGVGSGMGASHVRALTAEGARVVGFDVAPGEAPDMVRQIGAGSFHFLTADVRSAEDWDRVVADCRRVFGPPSVLVNNAGVLDLHRVDTATEDAYRRVIDINQVGTFLGMRAVVESMRSAGGGSIVNICSTAGLVAYEENFSYVASKWAVRGMTKAAALELVRDGIRVNAVCPGETDTPMIRDSTAPGAAVAPTEMPFGRWARPEEISAAVVFLASDGSSYMTGSDVVLDGGYTAA